MTAKRILGEYRRFIQNGICRFFISIKPIAVFTLLIPGQQSHPAPFVFRMSAIGLVSLYCFQLGGAVWVLLKPHLVPFTTLQWRIVNG